MKRNVQLWTRTGKQVCLVGIAVLLLTGFCLSQAAISLSPASGQPTTQAAWRQFHTQNMVRFNQFENVLNINNVGNLRWRWSFKTGGAVRFLTCRRGSGGLYRLQ